MKEWNATTMMIAKPRRLLSAKLDLDMLARLGRDLAMTGRLAIAVGPKRDSACDDEFHCAAFSPSLQRAHAFSVTASSSFGARCVKGLELRWLQFDQTRHALTQSQACLFTVFEIGWSGGSPWLGSNGRRINESASGSPAPGARRLEAAAKPAADADRDGSAPAQAHRAICPAPACRHTHGRSRSRRHRRGQRRSARSDRFVLYFHGGGYSIGTAPLFRDFTWRIGIAARACVLYFDYRLAPEHPFPAAVEDAVKVYRWLAGRVDPQQIAFMGDSAGG